ncbi:MAG: hypothetical protein C0428_00250 [Polaromonas sp.]|nr:hypothetical protein [Polaromonas sp.]
MLVAENVGHFQMVRHRHNFDQFRYVISGQMNLGGGSVIREGELCYFPEGTPYGPQDDQAGPLVLTVQFGGANGYGYMSPEQYRAGRDSLEKAGRFEGPVYLREVNGRLTKKFSINAIWEEAMGSRMLIPAPRYDQPVIMNPKAYRWTPVVRQAGCFRKRLGTFSERGTSAEMLRLEAGAALRLPAESATRLLFVLQGAGTVNDQPLGKHFGVQLDPDEGGQLCGGEELVILCLTLPAFETGWEQAEIAAVEPALEESVT